MTLSNCLRLNLFSVPDYQIVHPYTVDKHAKRGSHVRRSLHHSDPMYIHFNAFGKDFHLKITENKDLVPDNQVIEHYTEDGVQRYRGNPGRYSTGTIVSNDDSNVAFDHTSGLVCFYLNLLTLISRNQRPISGTASPATEYEFC